MGLAALHPADGTAQVQLIALVTSAMGSGHALIIAGRSPSGPGLPYRLPAFATFAPPPFDVVLMIYGVAWATHAALATNHGLCVAIQATGLPL